MRRHDDVGERCADLVVLIQVIVLIHELREFLVEFFIMQLCRERDRCPAIGGDMHLVVHGVGGARRNDVFVQRRNPKMRCARRNKIPVAVENPGMIEMRGGIHVLRRRIDPAVMEKFVAGCVGADEFNPWLLRVDGSTRKRVPHALVAHDDVEQDGLARHDVRARRIQRRHDIGAPLQGKNIDRHFIGFQERDRAGQPRGVV